MAITTSPSVALNIYDSGLILYRVREDDETRAQEQCEYSTEIEESLIFSMSMIASVDNDLTEERIILGTIVVGGVAVGAYFICVPLHSATSVMSVLSGTATEAAIEAVKGLIAAGTMWISEITNSGAVNAFA